MGDSLTNKEQDFREWMRSQYDEAGIRRYTDNAIIAYSHALRTCCAQMEKPVAGNLFYFADSLEFDPVFDKIVHSPDFERVNFEHGNGTFYAALRLYQAYLKHGKQSDAPDVSAPFYLKQQISYDIYSEDRGRDFNYEEVPMTPVQKIYYGAPGTGKSYGVNRMLEEAYPDSAVRDAHCRRLIFHPTYTYKDLVGSVKPLVTPDRPLDYIFAPGPLSILLKEAFLNPAEKYYLVIEEINRGNSPAIFGDLFQLLDRQENGKSAYAVQNYDMTAYFSRDPGLKKLFVEGKVWFPANFNILATMNTADENIFILDTAFKRRFTLEYVRIDFDKVPEEWSRCYDIFAGREPLTALFVGTALENDVNRLAREGKLQRNWTTFGRLVNKIVDIINGQLLSEAGRNPAFSTRNLQQLRIPENKKLGPFFVSPEDLTGRDTFINKVIFYLKQDVFTYSDHYMPQSYEEIYLKYVEGGADLFELLR